MYETKLGVAAMKWQDNKPIMVLSYQPLITQETSDL